MPADSKHDRILATLESEILGGKYAPGRAAFPSERALASRFKAARLTVRMVVQELKRFGYLSQRQGSGTFVTRKGANRKIGLVIPDMRQTEYFLRIVRELVRVAERDDYILTIGEVEGKSPRARTASVERIVDGFISQKVSGVILQPIEYLEKGLECTRRMLDRLNFAAIPVVLCDNKAGLRDAICDAVGTNNVEAGVEMFRYLRSVGARRIVFFMRPYSAMTHYERLRGAMTALLPEAGKALEDDSVLVAETSDISAIRKYLRSRKVDAFMCGDDETAAGLLQTLNRMGVVVPKDVMVTGFNDLSLAGLLTPPLTTMRISCEEIADAAFERLVTRISNPDLPPTEVLLPAELVVRESTLVKEVKG